MSYLDRLKRRISEKGPDHRATKVTKAPFVPFVASLSAPLRQISERDDPVTSLREAFEERAAIMEYDGGLSRKDAERMAMIANKA